MSVARAGKGFRVVVIGAGMSGILAGKRLQEEGVEDFVIYEKGDRLGGTWRDNRYPGLACDVPSHVYSYSFEPNPFWSRKFSPGGEILTYLEHVADKYGVTPFIRLETEIVSCTYDGAKWRLETADGQKDEADAVICATGVLHHPFTPEFEGLESFEGRVCHSARWPDDLSLEGKRVGIIGTGSTAVQMVTALTDVASELALFQRTPQWIYPQPNPTYSENDQARFADEPELLRYIRGRLNEGFSQNFSNAVVDAASERMHAIEDICREHLEQSVTDPELLAKLTPDYRAACKRLVMADGYYEALQKPNATLVTAGIDRIEANGVRDADGVLHELDVLVLATGFQVQAFMRPMNVVGRDGVKLNDVWKDAVQAYRSVSIAGFPNFFMIIGPQSPVGNFSLIEIAELQMDYVLQLMAKLRSGDCREICATEAATKRFNDAVVAAMDGTIWVTGCRSWYLDDRGVPATWPWTIDRFQQEMAKPDLADFERIA